MPVRRAFLKSATLAPLGIATPSSVAMPASPTPPRVLYSNDTTHITSCKSPWRDPRDGITDAHLRASVAEAKGVDVHLLQPGLGWIPWWQSQLYSPADHYETFLGEFGETRHNPYARYLLAGGDLVGTFVDECRRRGVKAFVSYRLNDGHHVRGLAKALAEGRPAHDMSRFFWENYERYRLGPDPDDWGQGVFDWRHPEVRENKLALIRELCALHPIDGLELDFLRHWLRFSPATTTPEERREITTGFVREVRAALDATSPAGTRRSLAVRVPAKLVLHPEQGIDLPDLVAAGVDLATLSWTYFTHQDDSMRQAKQLVPDTPVYAEMTHTTLTGRALSGSGTQPYLRTTDDEFRTTAHLAYEQGAAGVSLFNFPYYRAHSIPELGPFDEPPFHILPELGDPAFLAKQSRAYFLSAARRDPALPGLALPALLQRGETQSFTLQTASAHDTLHDGILRIRSDESIADREIRVEIDGAELKPVPFVEKPLPHPYGAFLGSAEDTLCYACPASLVPPGGLSLRLTLIAGIRVRVIHLDLSLSAAGTDPGTSR